MRARKTVDPGDGFTKFHMSDLHLASVLDLWHTVSGLRANPIGQDVSGQISEDAGQTSGE